MTVSTTTWATLSAVDALLKTVYKGPVIDELNSRDTIYGLMRKDPGYEGRSLVFPVLKSRAESHGFFASGAQIQTPIAPTWANLSVTPKYFYGSLRLDKEAMVQSRTDVGAFQRTFGALIERLPIDCKDTLDRILCGNGSGRLGLTTAVANSGTTYTWTIADSLSAAGIYPELRKFGIGMKVDQWSAEGSGTADATGWVVTDAPAGGVAGTVKVDTDGASTGTPVGTASHCIVRAGSRTTSTRNEAMGLSGIISTSDPPLDASGLQGVAVATAGNAYWKAYGNTSATLRPLSGALLQTLVDGASIKGRGKLSYLFLPYGVRSEYSELQQNVRRTMNTARISGDTTGGIVEDEDRRDWLEYNNIPLVMDKYMAAHTILGFDSSSSFMPLYLDWDWLDDDGRILKWVPNYASFEAILCMYGETACVARNRNAYATGVSGDDPLI